MLHFSFHFLFLFNYNFFIFFILNNKPLDSVVKKAEVEKHLCYFLQLQRESSLLQIASGLCITFTLISPNEHKYLIYSLFSGLKVIFYSSGSDIHCKSCWDWVSLIPHDIFLGKKQPFCMFPKNYFAIFYLKIVDKVLCSISCALVYNSQVQND